MAGADKKTAVVHTVCDARCLRAIFAGMNVNITGASYIIDGGTTKQSGSL